MTDSHLNWLSGLFIEHDLHAKGITFEQLVWAYEGGYLHWYLPTESNEKKTVSAT